MSELYIYYFLLFPVCPCTFSTCSFVAFASATVAHGIIGFLKKIDILFYEHRVYRGYSNFLLNMAFISPSEVENIYIS